MPDFVFYEEQTGKLKEVGLVENDNVELALDELLDEYPKLAKRESLRFIELSNLGTITIGDEVPPVPQTKRHYTVDGGGNGHVTVEEAPAAPKRRGRPPKNAAASTDAPKRRGRPPGSGKKAATATTSTDAPKRRGRPPGSKNKAASTATATETPKRRGRPPGSGRKAAASAPVSTAAPKRRGRPPGSTNRKRLAASAED